jgi:pimeloyl-ACP methyl ester carboxylesterase
MRVPLDYAHPRLGAVTVFLARSPATDRARRIGSLVINFGGPGGPAADAVEGYGSYLFPRLNRRFDVIGMDPRGVGRSSPAIDCRVNQETAGVYAQPFPRPADLDAARLAQIDAAYIRRCTDLNAGILPFVSTADVARDLDWLRRIMGERRLNYLGYSYGTFLGATYAAMFPRHYRAMVLDGAVNPDEYINHPLLSLAHQSDAAEIALQRFMTACAADQTACAGFGGADPMKAFDDLVAKLDATPQRVSASDPRMVDGDDLLAGTFQELYAKYTWSDLAQALEAATSGDYTQLRALTDAFYGRRDNGTYDPFTDRYFTLSADEMRYPTDQATFLAAGAASFAQHPHFWWNNGYVELAWGMYPVRARHPFFGPFHLPASAQPVLVVGTRYDPATPYSGAVAAVQQLGRARLLTMNGDGHTAYGPNSHCINIAVEAYFNRRTLPATGATCGQDVRFSSRAPRGVRSRLEALLR